MAKRKSNKASSTVRASREELRELAAKRRRNANILVIGGAAFLELVIAGVIYLNIQGSRPVGSEETVATMGNTHIAVGSLFPISYNTTPPTSGPHYPGLAGWGINRQPQRYEQLIHNLEDGGVIVYYQCTNECPELFDQLAGVVKPYVDQGRKVMLLPNDPTWTDNGSQPLQQDMEARIALVTWQRIDKFEDFDADRIRAFIDRYEGIDHH
jgi:hypothetical protein